MILAHTVCANNANEDKSPIVWINKRFLRKVEYFQTLNRNTAIGEKYRWPTTIPYYLEDSLGKTPIHHRSVAVVDVHVFAVGRLTCRHERQGGDPESVRPVSTEDLHRLHAVEGGAELHFGVQGQRVSQESLRPLLVDMLFMSSVDMRSREVWDLGPASLLTAHDSALTKTSDRVFP